MKKILVMAAMVAAMMVGSAQAGIIVQWDFNGGNDNPSVGAGSIGTVGGATHPGFNSGNGSSDPTQPGLGYQTQTYAVQGSESGVRGIEIGVSTLGFSASDYSGLQFSFDLRTSNTASRWYRVDYSADGGSSWTQGMSTRLGMADNAGDTWHNQNMVTINSLSLLENSDVRFRVVSVFSADAFTEANSNTSFNANSAYEVARNTTSNYGGGTWRFDMVTVSAVPEPSALLLVGSVLGFGALRRRRA